MGPGIVALAACALAGCRFDPDFGADDFVIVDASADAAIDAAYGAAYAAAVLADAPVLYLRLDDADAAARDSSPAGRDGIYLGGVTHLDTGALDEVNGAALFDGDNDQIGVNDAEPLRLNGDFTIELWVRAGATDLAYPGVVRKGDPSFGGTGYLIYFRGTEVNNLVFKREGMDDLEAAKTPLSLDEFHHYALVYIKAAETLTWYSDGEVDTAYDAIAFTVDDDTGDLSFARGDSFGAEALDEIALYDHALTPERLSAHLAAAGR